MTSADESATDPVVDDTSAGLFDENGDAIGLADGFAKPRRRWGGSFASCLLVLLVIGLIGGGLVYGVFKGVDSIQGRFQSAPDYPTDGVGRPVLFEVKSGDSAAAIGRQLKTAGIVESVDAFTEAAAADPEAATRIQVGFYQLKPEMSAASALAVLVDSHNLVQTLVTVPEGLRLADTLALVAKKTKLPLRKFIAASRDAKAIGLPAYANGRAEGYLFPATYPILPNDDPTSILKKMVDRWRQAADDASLEQAAEQLGYTPAQLMVVASLVESEANRAEDRGKVARVIYNRLETNATNHLLQMDATVNYAIGRDLGLGLTTTDLQFDSPYNTYVTPGLPPTPIEAPGDAAIAAATSPTAGNWIYYVTVNLDTGETRFTNSYDEFLHLKNVDLAEYCASSPRC